MPTLPCIGPFDGFAHFATSGKWYDELYRLEKIKKSFNDVHNYVRTSMDLNFKFLDGIIEKINHAVEEFETHEDEFDHKSFIHLLYNSIHDGFQPFNTSYLNAEFQLTVSIERLNKALRPAQANSYKHYVNDGEKDKVNEMIVVHMYRRGLFDVGDELISEAKSGFDIDMITDVRSKFVNMHAILDAARKCEMDIPLQWISDNSERLGEEKASHLQFMVHVIKYTSMVEKANMMEDASATSNAIIEALNYGKAHFITFSDNNYADENQKLIACILHSSKRVKLVGHSRYYHFFDGTYMHNLTEEIEKLFCIMMGQCGKDPIPTLTSVGEIVVSGVGKAASTVKKVKGLEWGEISEIPLKLSLKDKFKYHSQFACPLSKNLMQNGLNPPTALRCGHVFSLQQLIYLTLNLPPMGTVKCPYCSSYTFYRYCKPVYF